MRPYSLSILNNHALPYTEIHLQVEEVVVFFGICLKFVSTRLVKEYDVVLGDIQCDHVPRRPMML